MIPIELRKIIIENYKKVIKASETSRVLEGGLSTVYKLIKRYKETGNVEASYLVRQPKITEKHISDIEKLVIEQPDVTIEEIIEKLNLPIKKSQISNILRKLGLNFKKEASTSKRTKAS